MWPYVFSRRESQTDALWRPRRCSPDGLARSLRRGSLVVAQDWEVLVDGIGPSCDDLCSADVSSAIPGSVGSDGSLSTLVPLCHPRLYLGCRAGSSAGQNLRIAARNQDIVFNPDADSGVMIERFPQQILLGERQSFKDLA